MLKSVSVENTTQVRVSNNEVFGVWSGFVREMSPTWREAEAVKRVIQSNIVIIKGKKVNAYWDNKNVQSVLKIGSRKETLQNITMEVN